jgi:hypothetical protein
MLAHLSDDQLALWGCLGALILSATALYFSLYMGQTVRRLRRSEPQVIPLRHGSQRPAGSQEKAA